MPTCRIVKCKFCGTQYNAEGISPGFRFICNRCNNSLTVLEKDGSSQENVSIITQAELPQEELSKLLKLSFGGGDNRKESKPEEEGDTLIMSLEDHRIAEAIFGKEPPKEDISDLGEKSRFETISMTREEHRQSENDFKKRWKKEIDLDEERQPVSIEIPGYKIIRELENEDWEGKLYKAFDSELGWEVVLWLLKEGQDVDEIQLGRLLYEARLQSELKHPNLSTISEWGRVEEYYYFVNRFVSGRALKDLIKFEEISLHDGLMIMERVSGFLTYAHERGVIHRNISPSNIFIDAEGEPHLTGFGIGKDKTKEILGDYSQIFILGTPEFLAPEQMDPFWGKIGPATDVYAIGSIIYLLLMSHPPFQGDTPSIIKQILTTDPVPPRKIKKNIPKEIEAICLKCLEKDPEKRYKTPRSLSGDLRNYREGKKLSCRSRGFFRNIFRWYQTHRYYLSPFLILGCVGIYIMYSFHAVASYFYNYTLQYFKQEIPQSDYDKILLFGVFIAIGVSLMILMLFGFLLIFPLEKQNKKRLAIWSSKSDVK